VHLGYLAPQRGPDTDAQASGLRPISPRKRRAKILIFGLFIWKNGGACDIIYFTNFSAKNEVVPLSVIKSKRSTSDMEFLATARKLEIYTIQKCVNFPKRYTFYVSQPLAAAATRIYEDVKRANSIYPLNQHEVQIRRDYFLHANAELQSMISQLEVAQELFGIEMDTLKYWMDIVDTEIRLVKAVLKSDRARYKDLP
jgi:hypothetical protein